jgi:putative endonuclease
MCKHFVYILQSEKDGSYYKGCTDDLKARLARHNSGRERYTRKKMPWKLAWSTEKGSRSEAVLLESKLKNLRSRSRIEEFIRKYS